MIERAGFNVLGYASSGMGLGVVAREFAQALMANGHQVAIFDMDPGGGRRGFDMSLAEHFVPTVDALPHNINLWVIGAGQLAGVSRRICATPELQMRFNAVFLWWELPDLPPLYVESAAAFDAVVTGSEFVREAVALQVANVPVLMAQHPLNLSASIRADRSRFGLPADPLLFYFGFEPASDPERKNPFACVQAFLAAFPQERDVGLVIKVNGGAPDSGSQLQIDRLSDLVGTDNRIVLLREQMLYSDLLSLYASCDVVVSLHRSEGLGLIPLEAMRLGRAVIATGWSGNMTYMNHCNAALVSYAIVPVDPGSPHYGRVRLGISSRWAEPNVQHAAAWMRTLRDRPALRERMAQRAPIDSRAYNESAARTCFAEELQLLAALRPLKAQKNFASIARQVQQLQWQAQVRTLPPAQRFRAMVGQQLRRRFGSPGSDQK